MAIISFAMTVGELLSGEKTCTRRNWSTKYFDLWQKWYDEGKLIHHAYDKSPRNGGKKIGEIKLTQRPYLEKLADMPEEDLIAEGGMCKTLDEFYDLIGLPPNHEVTVVRFEFIDQHHGKPIDVIVREWRKTRNVIMTQVDNDGLLNKFSSGEINCPVCNDGVVTYMYSGHYNGHVHAECSTDGCVVFME